MDHRDPNEMRRQIVEIIGNCVFHALGLAESLEDEQRALKNQQVDALDSAIASKSKCVEDLRKVEQERKALCTAAGFSDEPEQMQRLIAWCDDYSVVANCWQHLMEIVAQCDSLNTTNGAIIRSRKHHIDTSISIIRGGTPRTDIYDRNGKEPQRNSLRSIAEV